VEQLKAKFAGSQSDQAATKASADVNALQAAILAQVNHLIISMQG